MLIQNIIDDINIRYPNGFSDEQIIKWINLVVEENWEDLAVDEVYTATLLTGEPTYQLPNTIDFSGINAVYVNEKEYTPKALPDYKTQNIYFKEEEGAITFNPKPNGGENLYIYHLHKPEQISTAQDDLRIRPQFAEIVKNAIFIIIAKAGSYVDLANNYVYDFNAALEDARQRKNFYTAAYPKVRVNQGK